MVLEASGVDGEPFGSNLPLPSGEMKVCWNHFADHL